ncbi:MAG TPA: DUF3108 domain-containing protein [Anaeromyxobacteraceae bacterium]|nr:DUF3108 domain-containing protein [Anaeromyxobacteraceae bacterium]
MYGRLALVTAVLALAPQVRAGTAGTDRSTSPAAAQGSQTPAPTPQAIAAEVTAAQTPAARIAFAPGEQIEWNVEYLGVRTGTARLQVGRAEGDIWPVIAQARTEGIAKLLEIREHFVSYWDVPRQLPRGSHLEALEIGDYHVEKTRFDRDQGKVTVEWTRKGKLKSKQVEIPHDVHDFASAILWLRLQPLAVGDVYDIPVFTGSHTFTMRAEVAGKESVKTQLGQHDTFRVDLQLGFKDEFKTSRPSRIWFTADFAKIPVKLAADFAVGSVVATLNSYAPGGDVAVRR